MDVDVVCLKSINTRRSLAPYLDQQPPEQQAGVGAGYVVEAGDELRDHIQPGGGGDGLNPCFFGGGGVSGVGWCFVSNEGGGRGGGWTPTEERVSIRNGPNWHAQSTNPTHTHTPTLLHRRVHGGARPVREPQREEAQGVLEDHGGHARRRHGRGGR